MATAAIYCTHKELKRVFTQLDSFDGKKQIYGWNIGLTDFHDTSLDIYYANSTGLVSQLFWDGAEVDDMGYPTTNLTATATTITPDSTSFDVDSGSGLNSDDIIKINNEYMRVVSVSTNTITVSTPATNRGLFGSNAQKHSTDSLVYRVIDADADIGSTTSANPDGLSFVYDSELDLCLLITNINPSDYLVEAGEDFTALVTQFRTDASRYIDSRLDPKLPKNQLKDKEGNFDYMIVRTTALYAAAFMVRTKDPTSEIAAALMLEADNNVQLLNEGRAALSWQNTGDASQGVLRDVTYTGAVRPVDFRGRAGSVDYDLIKLEIQDAGIIGTATYNVFVKDGNGLKQDKVVDDEKITGDYQSLAYGLQVRFAGNTDASEAVATDEWEVEVRGYNEEIDTSDLKGIKMTRTRNKYMRRNKF